VAVFEYRPWRKMRHHRGQRNFVDWQAINPPVRVGLIVGFGLYALSALVLR